MIALLPLLVALVVPNLDPNAVVTPAPLEMGYLIQPAELPIAHKTMFWSGNDYLVDRYEIWVSYDLEGGHWQYFDAIKQDKVLSNWYTFNVYNDKRFFIVLAVTPENLYSTNAPL